MTFNIKEEFDKLGVRPEVLRFAMNMELVLRRNDHKGGWLNCSYEYLISRIEGELDELKQSCMGSAAMQQECTDVANFSMMLYDLIWSRYPDNPFGFPHLKELEQDVREAARTHEQVPGSR